MFTGDWNEQLYCQIFTTNYSYQISKVIRREIWSNTWTSINRDDYNPVLLSCQVSSNIKPIKVSLNRKPCHYNDKTLIVRNAYSIVNERNFVTVCIKPLEFNKDISDDLMQWIEINKILGADGIDIYVKDVHSKVEKLLNYYYNNEYNVKVLPYESIENFVRRTKKITEKNSVQFITTNQYLNYTKKYLQENEDTVMNNDKNIRKLWQKRKNELISYNDCFYRNIHASDFILPVDIDEIIVPKQDLRTWKEVILKTGNVEPEVDNYASLAVQNTYFLKRFPTRDRNEFVFFLRHTSRTDFSPPEESTKSFVSTRNALTVFNHYALDVLKPGIRNVLFLPNNVIQMNHYRETCSINLLPQCVKYNLAKYQDTIMLKYRNEFYLNYNRSVRNFKRRF